MIKGKYELILECDNIEKGECVDDGSSNRLVLVGQMGRVLRRQARERSWHVSNKTQSCYCPGCKQAGKILSKK